MSRKRKEKNNSVKQWTTAIVVRLSKEDVKKVKDSNSDSIESQIKLIEEHIQKLINEGENIVIYDYYIDDGKSGALAENRPDFMRLLNDIEEEKVNCVIVKDASRLARNSKESTEFVEEYFVRKDVRYISLMLPALDSYKNPDEVGSLGTKMYDIVNEDFIRQTSLKTRKILELKKKLGLFVGSFAPYGYIKNPENKHQLLIDEYASNVLCQMRDCLFNGMTLKEIQIYLHNLGILNPTAYKKRTQKLKYENPHYTNDKDTWWNITTIKRLLKSQMNVGDMVQNHSSTKSYKVKEKVYYTDDELIIVEGTHEPIFSKSERKKILLILDKETKTMNNEDNTQTYTYLFTGFLKCGDCGRSITRKYYKDRENGYFQCKNYVDYGNEVCTRHYIKETELKEAVLYSIKAQISLLENYEGIIKDVKNNKATISMLTKIKTSLETKDKERVNLKKIKDELYFDWKNGEITHEDYLRLKNGIELQLDDIKKTLKGLKEEIE